jgi:hypothetical protein
MRPQYNVSKPVPQDEVLLRARRVMEAAFPEIAKVLTDAARAGDVAAGKVVTERLMPVARSAPIRNPITLSGDAAAQVLQVKDAMASGQLSLEEGDALLNAIDVSVKVCREIYELGRSEEFQRALLEEIGMESPECQERIVRRIAQMKRERGLVIEAEADAPAPPGNDDAF